MKKLLTPRNVFAGMNCHQAAQTIVRELSSRSRHEPERTTNGDDQVAGGGIRRIRKLIEEE